MATLLRTVLLDLRDEPLLSYVRGLLLAFTRQQASSQTFSALLNEQLSPQELRVLRLLVTGHANPAIAQELVVSINTVKTQVQSIYRKLSVKSRWEAREAAQRLDLL